MEDWGALLPRFRRQYQLDVRNCVRSMPWQDFVLLVDDLRPSWSEVDENAAVLVDVLTYWLEAEYVKWTTSPEEAERAAKSARKQPPPFPLIRPVAHRPPEVHAAAVARYEALVERYDKADGAAVQRQMTADEMIEMFIGPMGPKSQE